MSLTLACTWRPRGERERLQKLFPMLRRLYRDIVISVPAEIEDEDGEFLRSLDDVSVVAMPERGWGRYLAIQKALKASASHIHYADLDGLIHWIEVQGHEWEGAMNAIQETDCLIMGRTDRAMKTRPQAIQQTEHMINLVGSYLLNQSVDLGAGNRGFIRKAAQFVIAHSSPGRWGGAEWPFMLNQAGYKVEYLAVDGWAWETPDQYQQKAAGSERQMLMAKAYDQDVDNWDFRTRIAFEIIEQGLEVLRHPST